MIDWLGPLAQLFAFWGVVGVLSALKALVPGDPSPPNRRRRWPTNLGLALLNGLVAAALPASTLGAAQWASNHGFGLLNWLAPPWSIIGVVTVVVISLTQYAFHALAHASPLLWRLHQIHHCDGHLDATSAARHHPLEVATNAVFLLPVVVACGLDPVALAVYGFVEVNVALVTHMNVRLPAGVERCGQTVLVTPAVHRLHHSRDRVVADGNYGTVFSLWDRLFGTFHAPLVQMSEPLRFGVNEVGPASADSFDAQLALPFRRATCATASVAHRALMPDATVDAAESSAVMSATAP